MSLNLLSAGAAKGLVGALTDAFEKATGHRVQGSFGAVGAMKEQFLGGAPCDLIILSAAMIADLMVAGELREGSAADLGRVRTGVAVRAGCPHPALDTPEALGDVLRGASGLWIPDPVRATAGIHVMKVIEALGLTADLAPRVRAFPNGATAMAAMAGQGDAASVGLTQVTEILYTPGVELVAPLPKAFELATVYTVAVTRRAADPELAGRLAALLAGPEQAALRRSGGFE